MEGRRWGIVADLSSIGLFHTADGGYAALAADLQEPVRHLMDRAVIEATHRLRPGQFRRAPEGPYPLQLDRDAARQFAAMVQQVLATAVVAGGESEAYSYREQMARQARSLRRHVLNPEQAFRAFLHV